MSFLKNKSWAKAILWVLAGVAVVCEILMMAVERYFFGVLAAFMEFGFDGLTLNVAMAWAVLSTIGSVAAVGCLIWMVREIRNGTKKAG